MLKEMAREPFLSHLRTSSSDFFPPPSGHILNREENSSVIGSLTGSAPQDPARYTCPRFRATPF